MSDPNWSWKVEVQPSERDKAMLESLPSWMISQSTTEGTSSLETEEEVRAGLPAHFGDEFVKILWVVPFGEEPEDDWNDDDTPEDDEADD
jgi:hypothetical protein